MSRIYKTMAVMFVATLGLLALSGIPALRNAKHGWKDVLGGVGWFGGLLLALVLIALALYTLARAALDRARAT